MDSIGHILNKYSEKGIHSFAMISDHEVVIPLPELNTITTLDLRNKGREFVRKVEFLFKTNEDRR